jgi:hypothetical protein
MREINFLLALCIPHSFHNTKRHPVFIHAMQCHLKGLSLCYAVLLAYTARSLHWVLLIAYINVIFVSRPPMGFVVCLMILLT